MKVNIMMNVLFFVMFANMFSLSVLAFRALKIFIMINMAKYAVIRYLLEGSVLIISLMIGSFKNIIHNMAQ